MNISIETIKELDNEKIILAERLKQIRENKNIYLKDEQSALAKKITILREELQSLDTTKDISQKIEHLTNELLNINNNFDATIDKVSNIDNEIINIQEELAETDNDMQKDYEITKQQLEEEISKFEKNNNKLNEMEKQLLETTNNNENLEVEIKKLHNEIIIFKGNEDEKKQLLTTLSIEIAESGQILEETKKELEVAKHDLMATKDDLAVANDDLMSTKDDLDATKDDLEVANDDLEATKDDLMATKDNLMATKDHLVDTKDNLIATKDELVATKDDLDAKHNNIQELNTNIESKNQQIINLSKAIETKNTALANNRDEINQATAQLSNLQGKMDTFLMEKEQQQVRSTELVSLINNYQQDIRNNEERIKELQVYNGINQDKLHKFQKLHEHDQERQEYLMMLEEERNEFKERIVLLTKNKETIEFDLYHKEEQLVDITQNTREKNNQLLDLTRKYDIQEEKMTESKTRIDDLIDECEFSMLELNTSIDKQYKIVKQFQDNLPNIMAELEKDMQVKLEDAQQLIDNKLVDMNNRLEEKTNEASLELINKVEIQMATLREKCKKYDLMELEIDNKLKTFECFDECHQDKQEHIREFRLNMQERHNEMQDINIRVKDLRKFINEYNNFNISNEGYREMINDMTKIKQMKQTIDKQLLDNEKDAELLQTQSLTSLDDRITGVQNSLSKIVLVFVAQYAVRAVFFGM
uniref:Uncharacterized protein n=1 Tax=Megaviridae environmental sample TaxID=1737588 RepID=A0A5J6VJ31_9VIRU|nr:MAG: hypothetical protein [Megaviridae environmental sample]